MSKLLVCLHSCIRIDLHLLFVKGHFYDLTTSSSLGQLKAVATLFKWSTRCCQLADTFMKTTTHNFYTYGVRADTKTPFGLLLYYTNFIYKNPPSPPKVCFALVDIFYTPTFHFSNSTPTLPLGTLFLYFL